MKTNDFKLGHYPSTKLKLIRIAIPSTGVYQHWVNGKPVSEFSARPFIGKRRTWRKLKAISLKKAIKEANATPWQPKAKNFAALVTLYKDRDCPSLRYAERSEQFIREEKHRADKLAEFFGDHNGDEIDLSLWPRYKEWRIRQIKKQCPARSGLRAVDKDGNTLSNILNFGVAERLVKENRVFRGRPKYAKASTVRHCREVAPENADVIHKIADYLFDSVRSEAIAWQLLFGMRSGCRTSELLRLRLDAKNTDQAGFISDGYLWLNRSKGGVDEFCALDAEFEEMITCFKNWHVARHPDCPWYFPNDWETGPVNPGALGHALARVCPILNLPHITPHGLRSYYVTKRRSDGVSDLVIAGEIGDQTVGLLQTTYGKRPANWRGGKKLSWIPSEGLPAWHRWKKLSEKIVHIS